MEDTGKTLGWKDCPVCKGTGYAPGKFGAKVECDCRKRLAEANKAKSEQIMDKPILEVGDAIKTKAMAFGYIPRHRIDDEFNMDTTVENIKAMCSEFNCGVVIKKFDELKLVLNTLITGLRVNQMPSNSYILGASNGFGKTTFVNTCIKLLMASDRKVVPYISLSEIHDLMYEDYSRMIENRRRMYELKPEQDGAEEEYWEQDKKANECTWQDFVKADVVFCYLTGVEEECMWIEMSTLKRLLQLRSSKGLSTIVMMAESLDWYRNSDKIRRGILNEIINPKANSEGVYDKLIHKSAWLVDREYFAKEVSGQV